MTLAQSAVPFERVIGVPAVGFDQPWDSPLSFRGMTTALGRLPGSGHAREAVDREAEAAIEAFFAAACELEGEERATVLTLHLIARDQTYRPPAWLKQRLALHREALDEEFCPATPDPWETARRFGRLDISECGE